MMLVGCLPKSKGSADSSTQAATAPADLALNNGSADKLSNIYRGDDLPSKHCDIAIDPGPRQGAPGAGDALPGLSAAEQAFFTNGLATFAEVDSVDGSLPDTGNGLGPVFNSDSCASCHAFPAVGGSSPPVNPQIALATQAGATNAVPSFITANGPVREARFKFTTNPDGSKTDTRRRRRARFVHDSRPV